MTKIGCEEEGIGLDAGSDSVRKEDLDLYRKLVVSSAWRKQMPKLVVSLGLGDIVIKCLVWLSQFVS